MMGALLNGEPAGEWTQLRALHFGDGVFRTILVWEGRALDWDAHLQKLSQDCAALQLKMPDASLLTTEAERLIRQCKRAALKIIVCRQTEGRGYGSGTEEVERILLVQPPPVYSATNWTSGISAFRCNVALAHQPALAGIKHLNRLEQVMASRHWPKGMDEGILCDQTGHPICGTRTNLFWAKQGEIFTPSLDACGVSGMMQNKIMQLAVLGKIKIRSRCITWEELLQADEMFLSNSLVGIWPVRQLEDRLWQAPGPETLKLQSALNHPRVVE